MLSSLNSFPTSSISLLFGASSTSATTPVLAGPQLLSEATGYTDDVLKTGNAIGNIIAIVAGMKSSESVGAFTMDGAQRTDNADGSYSLTKTGKGTVSSEQEAMKFIIERAQGTGADAERMRSYLAAMKDGTLQEFDMSTMGVTSTMTQTSYYDADGRNSGTKGSYDTKGFAEFMEQYVVVKDGQTYDKATGKNATVSQNGTKFTYSVW